jgi:hypothetical protein
LIVLQASARTYRGVPSRLALPCPHRECQGIGTPSDHLQICIHHAPNTLHHNYHPGIFLKCLTWIASSEKALSGIFSQIGSTSGPSRSPAPSHPQHQTVVSSNLGMVWSLRHGFGWCQLIQAVGPKDQRTLPCFNLPSTSAQCASPIALGFTLSDQLLLLDT